MLLATLALCLRSLSQRIVLRFLRFANPRSSSATSPLPFPAILLHASLWVWHWRTAFA